MVNFKMIVDVEPVAQPRQRFKSLARGGKVCYTESTHPVQAYKQAIREAAEKLFPVSALDSPVMLDIDFMMPRPKRLMKKNSRPDRIPHFARPDVDNLAVAVLNSLTGIIYIDDAQVCDCRIRKFYHSADELPHVEITVQELDRVGH